MNFKGKYELLALKVGLKEFKEIKEFRRLIEKEKN